MFCERCGNPNPDGAQFCATCGARLAPVPSGSSERLARPQPSTMPIDPYDVEQPLYDPAYEDYGYDYDDDPYGPSRDWPYERDFAPSRLDGEPHGHPDGRPFPQSPEASVPSGAIPDYAPPFQDDDPYRAQYLSQQQYRAEHGYQTLGSPGPRGRGPIPEEADGPLRERRSLALYVALSILTLGIYGWYYVHCMAKDANVLCAADGERTTGVGLYVLFCILTLNIYSFYWVYKIADRLYETAPAYGLHFDQNGLVILLWNTIGMLVIVGPFIAMHYILRDLDELSRVYNERFVYNW